MKTIGYARVSSARQRDNTSLETQKKKIKEYCKLKDLNLLEIVVDNGRSAKTLKREGFQRIIKMAKAKEFDHLIVFKLDRAFRSVKDSLEVMTLLKKKGVHFHSITETIDTSSSMGKFIYTLFSALAELESGRHAERITEAVAIKKSKNEKLGRWLKFGYDLGADGKTLVKNKEEQKVIRKIIRLRDNTDGLSFYKIAKHLNEKGHRTKMGKFFSGQTIQNILKNERIEMYKKPLRRGVK